jgi:hypothetical protein
VHTTTPQNDATPEKPRSRWWLQTHVPARRGGEPKSAGG